LVSRLPQRDINLALPFALTVLAETVYLDFAELLFSKDREHRADNSFCRLWPSSLTLFIMEWKRVARPNNDGAQLN